MLFLIFFGLGVLTGAALILYGKEIEEKAPKVPEHSERFQFQDHEGMDSETLSRAILEFLASRDDARSGFDPGATMRRSSRFFSEDELHEAAENLRRLLRK